MKKSPVSIRSAFPKVARGLSLFEPVRPLLAAVSGGADSMALLYALREFAPAGFPIMAVHVHHGIRGRAADRDAAFVRARCRELGVPLLEGQVDVPAAARAGRLSLEMAARQERYGFFRKALAQTGASAVVTAHTADDQAETVLLKLIRGAGPRGLGGMAPRSRVLEVPVIRPFLSIRRNAVEAYLREEGRLWREDATNRDTLMLRNRLRHNLLPLLERRYNPAVREALIRTADVLREEEEWLQSLTEQALAGAADPRGRLDAARLKKQPPALRRRMIRLWLMRAGVPEERLDFELVERLERLSGSVFGTGEAEAGGKRRIVSEYGFWRVESADKVPAAGLPETAIRVPGETLLPDWGLRFRVTRTRGYENVPPPGPGQYPCRAWIALSAVQSEGLILRVRKPGDVIEWPGGTRKLQDWLIDTKIPRAERSRLPVLASGGILLWVAGGPVSMPGRVSGPRSPSYRLDVERLSEIP